MTSRILILLCVLLMTFAIVPCQARPIVTFAQFTDNGVQDFTMSYSSLSNTLTATANVIMTLSADTPYLAPGMVGPHAATLTLTATSSTPAGLNGANIDQLGYSGSFTFTLVTPIDGKSILLHGTFGPLGEVNGRGSAATLGDSDPPDGEVNFTSDFLKFDPTTEGFAISLSSVTPLLARNPGNNFLRAFTASGSGTFSAGIVPEPVTLLLIGAGLLGLGVLRQRRRS